MMMVQEVIMKLKAVLLLDKEVDMKVEWEVSKEVSKDVLIFIKC